MADAGDTPAQPRGFQLFDRMVAKNIARRQQRERDWFFIVCRGLLADHPDQLFLPHHLSAGEIIHAGHQRNIDFAALDASDQRRRERAVQLELNARKSLAENLQDRRQHEGGIEVGRAEHDVAFDIGRGELRQQFVMETEDRARVAQDGLAFRGEKQPSAFVDEDRLAGQFLEPLQLQGDRRLRAAEPPRGLGDASGLDDRHQRAQHPNIQVDEVHWIAHTVRARLFHAIFMLRCRKPVLCRRNRRRCTRDPVLLSKSAYRHLKRAGGCGRCTKCTLPADSKMGDRPQPICG